MTYYTTTLATAKKEKLIFTFFDQPYREHFLPSYILWFNITIVISYSCNNNTTIEFCSPEFKSLFLLSKVLSFQCTYTLKVTVVNSEKY